MKNGIFAKQVYLFHILLCCVVLVTAQSKWTNPIVKKGRLGSPLVESSPFVFKDKLYLLENNQRFWDIAGAKPGDFYPEDEVRIKEIASGKIVSVALKNHGFGTALIHGGRVYVFAGNFGRDKPWRQITEITMTSSADLKNWSKPVTVLKAHSKEFFFNTAVCKGKDKFILLYETNDRQWKPFTFRYVESEDLINWKEIPDAMYGMDKYVGGPALYYEGGWYYTLYLESLKVGYETRISRSKDLVRWEDAPDGRPFITFDPSHKNNFLINPDISESNASDVELCYYKGKTILYFTGSDQTTAGDLQWATYDGTPRQLFEYFFNDAQTSSTVPPIHQGDWAPVLIAPETAVSQVKKADDAPSSQQLSFQQRQLGAFIHFGPATYVNSEFLTVPDPSVFNPKQLDAEQWVRAAKSFGAQHIVLTAKHHNGFCLWPTKTTRYSVKSAPWKNGAGDVVKEFVAACRKYGIKPGLYVSAGDLSQGCTSTPDPMGKRKIVGDVNAYFPIFIEQIRELLTDYGPIDYLWFDGAYDPFGWDVMDGETKRRLGTGYGDAVRTMVRNLQPQAVVMGGTRPDVRWSGSEQGWASYPLWNMVTEKNWAESWVGPENTGWLLAEANVHTRDNWFWYPDSDKTLRTVDFLTKVYLESIGRGANLLINMTPDTAGLVPLAEAKRLADFGQNIETTFGAPLGTVRDISKSQDCIVKLQKKKLIGWIDVEEDISTGQHIQQYKAEALINGSWKTIAEGSSIGRRRIQPTKHVETNQVRLIYQSSGGKGSIKKFTLHAGSL